MVVKPYSADGTPSERTRESRPSPAPHQKRPTACAVGRFVFASVHRRTVPHRGTRARPSLASLADMRLSRNALAGASATAAAAAVILVRREQSRRTTDRFAAAALETLLNAIDANNPETGAHVRRVAAYSLILGEAAELSEHECKSIERIALFHDIGKIHEALIDIVRDDQPLSPADRRAIATHPAVGAKVLEPLSVFYS